jgi:hypothetical protein
MVDPCKTKAKYKVQTSYSFNLRRYGVIGNYLSHTVASSFELERAHILSISEASS